MKKLDGRELADYMTERQLRQVRALRQAEKVIPKLVIISTSDNPVIATYIRLKQQYGEDITAVVEVLTLAQNDVLSRIEMLNHNESVHGIIVQLPLADPAQTDEIVAAIAPEKDVDGLGSTAFHTPATALAIDWLLAGYNIDLKTTAIAIVGNGRLVGKPLAALWATTGYNVTVYDDAETELGQKLRDADIIITATGVPGLITTDMVKPSAVVVDAGTASENGQIVGDVAVDVRDRTDISITPIKGGVGPLTVTALFDNVINAARSFADAKN